MTPLTRRFAVLLLGALPGIASAAVYKWVDENGQVQYSQTPPPGGIETQEIKVAPPPPDDPEAARREHTLEEGLEKREEAREDAAKEASEDAEYKKQKAQRCEAAKHRLYQAERPRVSFIEPDGSERRATEEERQQQITESQKQVEEFCN